MSDTEGYGSASTPDSVTEKAVHQLGSDSQNGVWRDIQQFNSFYFKSGNIK